jgi:hypothetical protein
MKWTFADIGHGDREAARAGERIEGAALVQGQRDLGQRGAHGLGQACGKRRRLHALPGAHEQLVAEQLAQARQRVADGRLRQAEAARGAEIWRSR